MKIVVTGMGVVSPVGIGIEAFWRAVCGGEYGIRPITRFETDGFKFIKAGEVTPFSLPPDLADLAGADLGTQFAAAAASEALRNAGLCGNTLALRNSGWVLGTNFGGMARGENIVAALCGGPDAAPEDFSETWYQTAADHLAAHWQTRGPRKILSLSCSSGTAAIAAAADTIHSGRAKRMLAGGFDTLSRYAWSGLGALRTMTDDLIRPFDKNRKGTIFSEGAAIMVLEDADEAKRRGAPILGIIAGYATNNNAFHMTAPAKEGAGSAAVMSKALTNAGLAPEQVSHINAHGTGTPPNDKTETAAIKSVFKEYAERIPVTSVKSTLGHMLGAAGAAEAVAAILTIRDGVIPPTINFVTPDPECDLDLVINQQREADITNVLSNSAGIGGCNAALVISR